MWPFFKFCKLVEKFISSVPCGAKYWCKKVVVNKVMVQMGIPSTKSKTKCKLTELSMTGKKNSNEVTIWPILTCIGKDLVSGPPKNKSRPCSEWVWAAKYCQFANNSINLVINHIWAISLSFFGPTRNRDFWKKVINT